MIHTSHRFKIYKKRAHILITFGVLILPIVFILLIGQISEISTRALIAGIGISLFRLITAYFISLGLAIILAVFLGHGRLGDFFVPVFDLFQNLPSFALIPVFLILFGPTNKMAIIFTVTSILWPILFNILGAFRTVRTDLNEAAAVFGAKGLKKIIFYLIPLSFPGIIIGSIIGLSIGWEAIIGIEIIGLNNGIGNFLNAASTNNQQVLLFGVIALLLVVFSINKLIWTPLIRKSQSYGE